MKIEDIQLLDRYYHEADDVERIALRKQIRKRQLDYLDYFVEDCVFCGKTETIRNSQQIVIYDEGVSPKMQNWRPGSLCFRCNDCRKKKEALTAEYRELRKQSMRCRNEEGVVVEFTKYEMLMELVEVLRRKIKATNRTLDKRILSHLDNMTDMAYPMKSDRIRKVMTEEDIETFLRDRKKRAFQKWGK